MAESRQPDGTVFEILEPRLDGAVLEARYRGVLAGEAIDLVERIDFREAVADGGAEAPTPALARLLALALSLSYYKATLADRIRVAFPLSRAERAFLAALAEHGLGEYAYVNDLEWKLVPEVEAPARAGAPDPEDAARLLERPPLVAVGGGKDSIAAIEAIRAIGIAPVLFSVNHRGAIRASVEASGCEHVRIGRAVDQRLLEANAAGVPNGHVPVTAMNSLIGLIAAELRGCGPVVFANEESAEYGNLSWRGREINHQWSKSLAYEDLLRGTLEAEGLAPDRFFSLLRGFREIDITRAFARHDAYFDAFTSCNRAYRMTAGERSMAWCAECPKCAFVYLLLAPFMRRDRLAGIFGRDMLAAPDQLGQYRDILGAGDHKPFECVGEPAEALEALELVVRDGQWADSGLVRELSGLLDGTSAPASGPAPARVDRVPEPYRAAVDAVRRA